MESKNFSSQAGMGTPLNRSALQNLEKYPLVELTRIFDAAPERVMKAFEEPELAKQWWGPQGFTCPEAHIDFRVGGKSHLCMTSPKGEEMWSIGTFLEIVPNRKIVVTDNFADEDGNIISGEEAGMDGDWPEQGIITLEFKATGNAQTEMKLTHEGIPASMHDDCVQGWSESLDKLKKVVELS